MRMSLRKRLLVLLLLSGSLYAQSGSGSGQVGLVSAEVGSLEIVRHGKSLPSLVRAGTELHLEDLVRTGLLAGEVILNGRGRLRLDGDTVIHLRATPEGDVEVELLVGRATLAGEGGIIVSGDIVATSGGGILSVATYPGDIRAVVSGAGRHEVVFLSGEGDVGGRRFVEMGRPVIYDGRLRNVEGQAVSAAEEAVRSYAAEDPGFHAARMEAYLSLRERFDAAYTALLEHRSLLNQWFLRMERGLSLEVQGDLETNERLRNAVNELLPVAEAMERRYYQLRLDLPYLSQEHRRHLAREDAFILDRLHQVRRVRRSLGPALIEELRP